MLSRLSGLKITDGHATAQAFAAQLNGLEEQAKARGAAGRPFSTPFQVQFEVKSTDPRADRAADLPGWSSSRLLGNHHAHGGDCSHKKDGGGTSFVRVYSPELTVENGGLQQIADVLKKFADMGAGVGKTSAMRVKVRDVSDDTLRTLVHAHQTHEDILFRLARGGGRGRSLSHKKTFAYSLREIYANGSGHELRRSLSHPYWSITTASRGYLEFRYFDTTLKAAPMQANVALVLGLVSAAAEGRLRECAPHPPGGVFGFIVKGSRWQNFMNETVGAGPIQEQLRRQFQSANGKIW